MVSDMSQQREHDIAALVHKHEQQIAELINKHEQAVLELRAGQDMLMRSEVLERRGDDADVGTLIDSRSVVPTSSTDSVYLKTRPPPHWVSTSSVFHSGGGGSCLENRREGAQLPGEVSAALYLL